MAVFLGESVRNLRERCRLARFGAVSVAVSVSLLLLLRLLLLLLLWLLWSAAPASGARKAVCAHTVTIAAKIIGEAGHPCSKPHVQGMLLSAYVPSTCMKRCARE